MYGQLNSAADTKSPLCPPLRSLENMRREEGKQLSPRKTHLLETLPTTQTTGLRRVFIHEGHDHLLNDTSKAVKAMHPHTNSKYLRPATLF